MRVVWLALALFLIGCTSSFAYVNEKFRVEGLAPSEYVVFSSKQYKSYKCTPSDIGDLIWCRKSEKRKFLGQMVNTVTSITHRDDGEVLYISYTMSGVKFDDSLASEQIGYLHHVFDQQPRILKVNTRTPSLKNGVIAYWGAIDLLPLSSAERSMIEKGQATGKGYLIDYLTSYKDSVRERLPIYSISNGYGYIYLISKGSSGKGTISFRAINNQAIMSELSKSAEIVGGRISELEDGFAEIGQIANELNATERVAFDQLYQDFKNDSAINTVQKTDKYNTKLNAVYAQMSALIKRKEQRKELLEKLEPMHLELKAVNTSELDADLEKEHTVLLSNFNALGSSVDISHMQMVNIETQYKSFKDKKAGADRFKAIKGKVQSKTEFLEKNIGLITSETDQDVAKTLILKAKAVHSDTSYDNFIELDAQFNDFDKKISDLKEFKELSGNAVFLINKIEGELKDVIDDGSTVQALKEAIINVQKAIKTEKIDELKVSVSALASLYEHTKSELQDKTFNTF